MALLHGEEVRLFSLHSNPELAQEIADFLGIPLSECSISRFADGEVNLTIKETVRGHHCFVVQSTNEPVNEHYMELLIMIDALKRASAKTINIIMPYYGYSRQDRKALARQPISAKLMADLLTVAGATRVLCMAIIGDVKGKNVVLVDDIIDTAGSAVAGVAALTAAGAKDIYMCASHGLLSGPAIERIKASNLKELIITNSTRLSDEKKDPRIVQLSVAKIFGQGILNIIDNKAVSDLFTYDPNKEF